MLSTSFELRSEQATVALGICLASQLQPGMVVGLIGHLGAGKTRLVQAVAAAAGVTGQVVNSPTFVLVQEYTGRWPIQHFDAYRLRSLQEFEDLGTDEYFSSAAVCFVEWADLVVESLPADALWIELQATGDVSRRVTLRSSHPAAENIFAAVHAAVEQG